MTRPIDLIAAIEADDPAAVRRLAAAAPRALRSFVAIDRSPGGVTDPPAAVPGATEAGPQSIDAEMWLALHFAAAAGRATIVATLIDEFGVSVDSRTRYRLPTRARQTPLMLAAARGHTDTVAALLERGAEPALRDAASATAMSLAAAGGHAEIVEALLANGADPDPVDGQGRTPLHLAIRGDPGSTPVDDATRPRHVAAALRLIDAGGDVNHPCPREPEGFTPLHRCVTAGPTRLPVLEALLARGADPSRADPRHGRTPLDLVTASMRDDAATPSPPPSVAGGAAAMRDALTRAAARREAG